MLACVVFKEVCPHIILCGMYNCMHLIKALSKNIVNVLDNYISHAQTKVQY